MTIEQAQKELETIKPTVAALWAESQRAKQVFEAKANQWCIEYKREEELLTFIRLATNETAT